MPEWTGIVVATSEFGIKVVDKGEWLNWSLPEYRGEPFDTVGQGDKVRIEYAKGKGDKTYISVIENLTHGYAPPPGSPFPPEDEFGIAPDPSDMSGAEYPSGAPQSPSGDTVDKDHSIVRQTCIKAAGMALQHNMGNAEEKAGQMTYLAGVLEDWCWR